MRIIDVPGDPPTIIAEPTFVDHLFEKLSNSIEHIPHETLKELAEVAVCAPILGYAWLRGYVEGPPKSSRHE